MSAKKTKDTAPEEKQKPQASETETPAEETEQATEVNEADTLRAQLEEQNNTLLRTLAEYDNYRKRSQKERMEIYPEAIASTVSKFLPVLDSFERALQTESSDTEFKKGVDMIFTSFKECLKALNVEEINPTGEQFDPNLHNAVMHIEDENLGENVVSTVMQTGYKIGDRVLRHAMVQVAN